MFLSTMQALVSFSKLEDIKLNQFENIFATNVFGLTMLTQEVVKFFKTQQHGSLLLILVLLHH